MQLGTVRLTEKNHRGVSDGALHNLMLPSCQWPVSMPLPKLQYVHAQDWHQKLHNNTTPDDIAICEAYIAFLEANGDNGAYWRVLSDAGTVRLSLMRMSSSTIAACMILLIATVPAPLRAAADSSVRNMLGIGLSSCAEHDAAHAPAAPSSMLPTQE